MIVGAWQAAQPWQVDNNNNQPLTIAIVAVQVV